MKVIARDRGSGKTHDLIKMARQTDSTIVCANKCAANCVGKQAEEMKIRIKSPISISDLPYIGRGARILIDNAECVLSTLLPNNEIIGLTITKSDDRYEELKRVAQPLVDYLRENFDSDTTILVENDYVTVRRDEMGMPVAMYKNPASYIFTPKINTKIGYSG